jgi:hypothetical protein
MIGEFDGQGDQDKGGAPFPEVGNIELLAIKRLLIP